MLGFSRYAVIVDDVSRGPRRAVDAKQHLEEPKRKHIPRFGSGSSDAATGRIMRNPHGEVLFVSACSRTANKPLAAASLR